MKIKVKSHKDLKSFKHKHNPSTLRMSKHRLKALQKKTIIKNQKKSYGYKEEKEGGLPLLWYVMHLICGFIVHTANYKISN